MDLPNTGREGSKFWKLNMESIMNRNTYQSGGKIKVCENCYPPSLCQWVAAVPSVEVEKGVAEWVDHYNHQRYHESLDNVTPADVYEGRRNDILDQRAQVKARTMTHRKIHNLRLVG
jgi:transposase InsO family protein